MIDSFIIVFIAGLITSLTTLWYGIKFGRKVGSSKEIAYFKLQEEWIEFTIPKQSKYTVSLVGGLRVKGFYINIISPSLKAVEITEMFLKLKFYKNTNLAVTYCEFEAEEVGAYSIRTITDKLSVKPSALLSKSLFEKEVPLTKLSIVIKEHVSPLHFIFSLLLIFIGVSFLLLNVCYLLYKLQIIVPTN